MRTRTFLDRAGRKKCSHITVGKPKCDLFSTYYGRRHIKPFFFNASTLFSVSFRSLNNQSRPHKVEKQKCMQPECSITDMEIPDPKCPMTPWSDWSPCSVTCGKGVQIRTRLLLVEPEKEGDCRARKELNQQRQCGTGQDCVFDYETASRVCTMSADGGSCRGTYKRFFYDPSRQSCIEFEYGGCRGNQNNFLTSELCMKSCSVIRTSGSSNIPNSQQTEQNTLQPITASPRAQTQIDARSPRREQGLPVDCVLSEWSDWSACSVACGKKLNPS